MPDLLVRGQTFPDFTLEDRHGDPVSIRGFYMRRKYVIAIIPEAIDDDWITWLSRLREAVHGIPAADGAVICLAIIPPESDTFSGFETDDRFNLLVDEDGRVRTRFETSRDYGTLIVADHYGVIFHTASGKPAQPEMNPDEVPDWIELIACRCS
jgi:peroxiredoxin